LIRKQLHLDCRTHTSSGYNRSASLRPFFVLKLNAAVDFTKNIEGLSTFSTGDGTCALLSTTCVATGAVSVGLLASGIGFTPGLVLESITGAAGLLDITGVAVSRRCAAKAAKHEAVRVWAMSKQNTVHSHISKALGDCRISDEYKLILDEVEKYRALKENLSRKHVPAAGSMVDEETKKIDQTRPRTGARLLHQKTRHFKISVT